MQQHVRVPKVEYTEEDIEAIVDYYAVQARENFWAYRQFMDPDLVKGWFPMELSYQLQLFYEKLVAGKRPMMVIMAPPQHGKTRNLQDFVSWVAGKAPNLKTIYASFSKDLGTITNGVIQRNLVDEKYSIVFPNTTIGASTVVTQINKPKRNSSLIEYAGYNGYFRNTTVQGQITGKSLDIGIIDDPIKGRAEASSKTQRDKAWNWLMDDFFTRFSNDAGMILTATRWHVDDPTGRFIARFPDAIVLTYPAVSAPGCRIMPHDPRFNRGNDLPLFSEFKDLKFLLERRKSATTASWESLYQQSPIVTGGGVFPLDRVKISEAAPLMSDIKRTIRYWDKAGTTDAGAFTAGVRMHQLKSGGWFIDDVKRGQWGAFERERIIKSTAEGDAELFDTVSTWTEQEPGSGGKESAERTIANLAGLKVYADKVTGAKEVRADPYAAQWQGGNVTIKRASWNDAFLDEHEAWPNSKFKDQVDAAAGAFAKTLGKQYNYDTSMDWADHL